MEFCECTLSNMIITFNSWRLGFPHKEVEVEGREFD